MYFHATPQQNLVLLKSELARPQVPSLTAHVCSPALTRWCYLSVLALPTEVSIAYSIHSGPQGQLRLESIAASFDE
jgi:hypothetical protein